MFKFVAICSANVYFHLIIFKILACNFDPEAEADDGSCIYGCSDENACNYDETSTCDASCVFPPPGQDCDGLVLGCTDDNYLEYYTQGFVADLDDGSCQTIAAVSYTHLTLPTSDLV